MKKDSVDKVDYILDGGDTKIGLESTVIRVINNKIHILRPGKITYDDIVVTTRGTLANFAYYTHDCIFKNIRINSFYN